MIGAVRACLMHGRNVRIDALKHLSLASPMAKSIAFPRYKSSLIIEPAPTDSEKSNLKADDFAAEIGDNISHSEARKLLMLVNVEALKAKLGVEDKEVIAYPELLKACESLGVANSLDEAASFARILDAAGVVLLFRDKVYLHPQKVADLIRRSVPLALSSEDDPRKEELKKLQEEKEKLDILANKQVRRILWLGLGIAIMQVEIFFRLTFWEYSWDVMGPIAYFAAGAGLVVSYAYFLITSRDPSYQGLMERLFLSRQRKLFKKHKFDIKRFKELQAKCKFDW